jgi:hypothetical protein
VDQVHHLIQQHQLAQQGQQKLAVLVHHRILEILQLLHQLQHHRHVFVSFGGHVGVTHAGACHVIAAMAVLE